MTLGTPKSSYWCSRDPETSHPGIGFHVLLVDRRRTKKTSGSETGVFGIPSHDDLWHPWEEIIRIGKVVLSDRWH